MSVNSSMQVIAIAKPKIPNRKKTSSVFKKLFISVFVLSIYVYTVKALFYPNRAFTIFEFN